jgi:hypothetical protein
MFDLAKDKPRSDDNDDNANNSADTDEHTNKTKENNKYNKIKNKKDNHKLDNLDDKTPVLSLPNLEVHTDKWTSLSQTAKTSCGVRMLENE